MNDELIQQTINKVVEQQCPEMTVLGKRELEQLLIRKVYRKGEIILDSGEICQNIILVGRGFLRQFYYKNGKDITEHFSNEGSVVMCIESLFKQEPTSLLVEALEHSTVYFLPYKKLLSSCETSRELTNFLRKILEYSLITSQIKADSLRFESARERYDRLLKNFPDVIKRAPLSYIASFLLMTPETLSRVRAEENER